MATERASIVGPDSGPESPYPLHMSGTVISGFGRGSKELGIPTANLPVDTTKTPWITGAKSGVYFGWASLGLATDHPDAASAPGPFPMVMSIGYNPFYKNDTRSAEVHVLRPFAADFYGAEMKLLLLGFIREELDYTSLEALVKDINIDCDVARKSLEREAWKPKGLDGGTLDGSFLVLEDGEAEN